MQEPGAFNNMRQERVRMRKVHLLLQQDK
jgi:hypothetical protein